MLTFEEFMKKKKIDLVAMQQGEPSLFGEFKTHYNQMGEKSFDHTKKYWFNKLRHQYQLSPEVAVEKVHIENKLAEQTIINTITSPELTNSPRKDEPDTAQQKPKVGFTPKFRAANVPKPAEDTEQPKAEETTPSEEQQPKPKVGFTPKFRAANAPKPTEDTAQPKAEKAPATPAEEKPAAAKPGFTPRFKAANMAKSTEDTTQPKAEEAPATPAEEKPAAPKLGFTPKFRAANAPKPADDAVQPKAEEIPSIPTEEKPEEKISSEEKPAAPKLGFTPKFRAANAPKPTEDTQQPTAVPEDEKKYSEENEAEKTAKTAYKPRFNMKNIPPKPPQE